jgi:hypothetical protein
MHTVDVYNPDGLIAGNADLLVATNITLAAGPALPRGAVLGKVTLSGHYTLSQATDGADPANAIEDGSEVPDLILVEDAPASDTTRPASAFAEATSRPRKSRSARRMTRPSSARRSAPRASFLI